jgi:hypothetical protein
MNHSVGGDLAEARVNWDVSLSRAREVCEELEGVDVGAVGNWVHDTNAGMVDELAKLFPHELGDCVTKLGERMGYLHEKLVVREDGAGLWTNVDQFRLDGMGVFILRGDPAEARKLAHRVFGLGRKLRATKDEYIGLEKGAIPTINKARRAVLGSAIEVVGGCESMKWGQDSQLGRLRDYYYGINRSFDDADREWFDQLLLADDAGEYQLLRELGKYNSHSSQRQYLLAKVDELLPSFGWLEPNEVQRVQAVGDAYKWYEQLRHEYAAEVLRSVAARELSTLTESSESLRRTVADRSDLAISPVARAALIEGLKLMRVNMGQREPLLSIPYIKYSSEDPTFIMLCGGSEWQQVLSEIEYRCNGGVGSNKEPEPIVVEQHGQYRRGNKSWVVCLGHEGMGPNEVQELAGMYRTVIGMMSEEPVFFKQYAPDVIEETVRAHLTALAGRVQRYCR